MTTPIQMLPAESAESGKAAQPEKLEHRLDEVSWLACTLSLDLPVVRFTIADLLTLAPGSIVETAFHHTSDVPLRVNRTLIGWTEFDVVDDRLTVRITDQA